MPESLEMEEMSAQPHADSETSNSQQEDGTLLLWSWTAASLITILAAVFTLFPQFLLFLSQTVPSSSNEYRGNLTPLESFLATHFGLWLLALAATLILNIPSSTALPSRIANPEHPLLTPFTVVSLLGAFISWNTRTVGSLASLYCLVTGISGIWGLWTIVFYGTSSHSKKTGADKHTSRFIFGNKSAASEQKKKWKAEQKRA